MARCSLAYNEVFEGMLDACMIDGFGWFDKSDYRRAFLLFDHVDYVFPAREVGPLWYLPAVFERPEYRPRRVALDADGPLLNASIRLCCDDARFQALVATIPAADRHYASQVVRTDPELAEVVKFSAPDDEAAPIVALISKLLLHASRTGTVPIVGKAYAWTLLGRVVELCASLSIRSSHDPGLVVSSERRVALSAFGAGLSLRFLDGNALVALPFQTIAKFKERNEALLHRHQLHLVEVAQSYQGLPDGPHFADRLAALRIDAEKKRAAMDDEASSAWRSMGLDLAKQAIITATASAIPAIAALRGSNLGEILGLSVPAVLATAAITVKGVLDASEKARRAVPGSVAYLFEAERFLKRDP